MPEPGDSEFGFKGSKNGLPERIKVENLQPWQRLRLGYLTGQDVIPNMAPDAEDATWQGLLPLAEQKALRGLE